MKPERFSGKKSKRAGDVKTYDVVVIGSGSGMQAVENAMEANMRVALVDNGPAGGTCLNLGCIPSKMMIAAADRVMEIREADRFGISANITGIDFKKIMHQMKEAVVPDHQQIHQALQEDERFDYYEGMGRFVDDFTLEVNGQQLKGDAIFIASGARPRIPDIKGLDSVDYLTSDTVLELTSCPRSMAIIGGGYIAAEYGHFFSAMGADVTIFQHHQRLVPTEEPAVSQLLAEELQKRLRIESNAKVTHVARNKGRVTVTYTRHGSGEPQELEAEQVLVAVGRQSNADRLETAKTGVELDDRGFIKVDPYLQTTRKGIWSIGDANGRYMFTHVANAEAAAAWSNAFEGQKQAFDYNAAPRAVFTYPPIASVGLTEAEARKSREVMVGTAEYDKCAKGIALRQDRGFAKVILDRENLHLLGFHIIGPQAPVLIQEVVNAMAADGNPGLLVSGMHIHPALSELILKTFSRLA